MMRTRGLSGPFFGKHFGNRASHPLAHSQGNAISAQTGGSELGPELFSNPNFDDGTAWVTQTGWLIGGGVATGSPGQASNISQTNGVVLGTLYRIEFDLVTVTAGGVFPQVGGASGTPRTTPGRYSEDIIASDSNLGVAGFRKDALFSGTIDNASCKQVLIIESQLVEYEGEQVTYLGEDVTYG